MGTDGVCLFYTKRLRKVCGAPPSGGFVMNKTNAVIDSLKKVYTRRSTTWWQSLHTRMMKEDPENRIIWMWDKMATCWAGKEDWIDYKKKEKFA